MMQDSFIFSGTIMDNIRYGNREASDEDVIRALKAKDKKQNALMNSIKAKIDKYKKYM